MCTHTHTHVCTHTHKHKHSSTSHFHPLSLSHIPSLSSSSSSSSSSLLSPLSSLILLLVLLVLTPLRLHHAQDERLAALAEAARAADTSHQEALQEQEAAVGQQAAQEQADLKVRLQRHAVVLVVCRGPSRGAHAKRCRAVGASADLRVRALVWSCRRGVREEGSRWAVGR
eukprot:2841149-Rhodomonas_salina.1